MSGKRMSCQKNILSRIDFIVATLHVVIQATYFRLYQPLNEMYRKNGRVSKANGRCFPDNQSISTASDDRHGRPQD